MAANVNVALDRVQNIGRDVIAALPNVLIALVVLLIWLVARGVRSVVERVWRGRGDNLGRLFGRLASGGILVLGVLVGVTIIFPSVAPASLFSLR